MRLDQDQLEWIVQEVLRRLQSMDVSRAKVNGSTTLVVDEPLVALSTLEGRIRGIRQLRVTGKAVVTPAVRDLLKERQIELVRGDTTPT